MKKYFRLGDLIIIAVVLLAAASVLVFFRPEGAAAHATISVDGQVYRQIHLPSHETITLENGVVISFDGMKACILSSDCPDHTCVKNGWLTKAGQSSICLPNRTVLQLDGGDLIMGG